MENQHREIKGYRELDEDEIQVINEIKSLGVEIETLVNRLFVEQRTDKRWVSIGKTDLQTGLMALTRSIAQPESF